MALNPDIPTLATELGKAGYNLGYAGKWHVDRDRVPTEHAFEGKDFPGYVYPPSGGVIEALRFGGGRREPFPHYPEYLKQHGYEIPKVLDAFYGDNPSKQSQEMYALQSGTVETTFEYMVIEHATELLRRFKEAHAREDKPFFLWANFWGPHTPCLLPEPYYSMYDPKAIPEEPSFTETWDRKPRVQELYERFCSLRSVVYIKP